MGKILVLCATHRDVRELELIPEARKHAFIFHDYADLDLERFIVSETSGTPLITKEIERIFRICRSEKISAVISTDDYPGSALESIVSEELRLPGHSARTNLICQHKYYLRMIQKIAAPEATCAFELLDINEVGTLPATLSFPFFVKPVKSFFSIGACRIHSKNELDQAKRQWNSMAKFFRPYEVLLETYAGLKVGSKKLIAEQLAEGVQVTVEGYVYKGKSVFLGTVDSIFIPGTISFKRFEYPSSLPGEVQQRMYEISRKILRQLQYNHGFFNMEFIYNPETDHIKIIEMNPRMSSQFADLFEKVDGTNSYSILLDLACDKEPVTTHRLGKHKMAASCILRTKEDRIVQNVPDQNELEGLRKMFPDIRIEIHATQGQKLSYQIQDSCTYRYGIVNIGGRDRKEILECFDLCRNSLNFVLVPIGSTCEQSSSRSKKRVCR